MKLALRIRIARQQVRLSQEQLALELGVTRGAVANWECTDGALPASSRLAKLAEVTGVTYEWLATGRGPMLSSAKDQEDIPAVEAEMVHDADERRLLAAFRRMSAARRQRFVLQLEADLMTRHKASR
ncbi:helix-turn-helix transcriptional regulator [Pseudoxanthomonas putridarboris]|uniref:Helix-turn-helix transcriptional regulator n=1 Tax=Pseudoxanthomonas putridarboris TaxID=752605 RepID=A0ABU9J3H6_9GAMM